MRNESVTLVFEASENNLCMLRLVVSSLAACSQFDVDKIEDLTTAVSEICMHVSAYARDGERLTVCMTPGEEFIAAAEVLCAPEFTLPPNENSNYLIGQLVDAVSTDWKKGERLSMEVKLRRV